MPLKDHASIAISLVALIFSAVALFRSWRQDQAAGNRRFLEERFEGLRALDTAHAALNEMEWKCDSMSVAVQDDPEGAHLQERLAHLAVRCKEAWKTIAEQRQILSEIRPAGAIPGGIALRFTELSHSLRLLAGNIEDMSSDVAKLHEEVETRRQQRLQQSRPPIPPQYR